MLRDFQGMALKFYSEDGIYDILTLSAPTFFIGDSMRFADFANSGENSPAQGVDFFSLAHESMSALLFNRAKFGTPKGYGHTPFF